MHFRHGPCRACLKTAKVAYSGSMKYVLGLDGGGTKTECVLMDVEGAVCAQGRSGPSNPLRVGFGGALAALCEAARWAMQDARVAPDDVVALCAGVAGAAADQASRKMKKLLSEEFAGRLVYVCTDLELTLEATGEGAAIVLVAGTGSAAVGRDMHGNVARVGGHGPLLGDEGSAYDIGKRASIAALREKDRTGKTSELGAMILKELRMNDWQEFQSRVHAVPDEVFPRIFPVIGKAADAGDSGAQELLRLAATQLALLVDDLADRLRLGDQEFLLVKTGGMVQRSKYFDEQINHRLQQVAPRAQFGAMTVSAAEAAARIALRLVKDQEKGTGERGEA